VISEEPFVNIEVVKAGRDPNQTYSPGTVVRVSCGKGYGLNIGANVTAKCVRGQWKPAKPECLICKSCKHFYFFCYDDSTLTWAASLSPANILSATKGIGKGAPTCAVK
jgi:hypothetical protein